MSTAPENRVGTDEAGRGGSESRSSRPIVVRETLDCAHKVRIHYRLPIAVTEDLLAGFAGPDVTVDVQRFSERVAGAKDHFTVIRPGELRAAGVLGEREIVATFGKSGGERPERLMNAFQRTLERIGAERTGAGA